MVVLGIDTSTILSGVAVCIDGRLKAEARCDARAAASERIIPQMERVLGDLGLSVGDLERIAVSIGPGSFTGLRVGLATAKGLAFGAGVGVVPVGSLEARIHSLGAVGSAVLLCSAARRGEVFVAAGIFDARGAYRELLESSSRKMEEAPAWIEEAKATAEKRGLRPLLCAGDAIEAVLDALPEGYDREGLVLMARGAAASAPGSVALLGEMAPEAEVLDGEALDRLEPKYLRGSDARRPGRRASPGARG